MITTHPFIDADGDKLREECGIFGVIGAKDAAAMTALGLHALQHRGQHTRGGPHGDTAGRDLVGRSARAFCRVSSCSASGTESATTPAPACTYIVPSFTTAVRTGEPLSSGSK